MSDRIPDDILVLIFKHLPVKTLLRFRCACKGWKQLIDSPFLIQQHLSVQRPRFILDPHRRKYLVVDPLPRPVVSKLSKPIETRICVLLGTLHGVVCLYDFSNANLVLWNPSLRKFSSVPSVPGFRGPLMRWPSIDSRMQTCYGFWVDPSTKEFKVIIIQKKPVMKCILYSSIGHSWSVIPMGKLLNWKSCKEGPPVMIGGAAHWGGCLDEIVYQPVYEGSHHDHQHEYKVILSFDFVQEIFDLIEMPYLCSGNAAPFRWQGTLSVLCWGIDDFSDFPTRCRIYLRQEDSWVEMVRFELFQFIFHAFWAMEDVEERKKYGKRKRDTEERFGDSIGETRDNVRVLAIVRNTSMNMTGDLILDGTKTGSRTVMKEIREYDETGMAYDFVESLLFPRLDIHHLP